jgi:hypothetical protein
MSPEESRRAAVLKFGGIEAIKEAYRDQRDIPLVATIREDAMYAIRGWRRNPGFAITAILSLTLGIGTATAIFTVADGVLLKALPYPDPGRLVTVSERSVARPWTVDQALRRRPQRARRRRAAKPAGN